MPPTTPGVPTPTRRLLACAEQVARRYGLPQADGIALLATEEEDDPSTLREMTYTLLRTTRLELSRSEEARRAGHDYDPVTALARYVMTGTTIAHKLRTAATAGSSAAPTQHAWELLAALTTLLYLRAKATDRTYDLSVFYDTLAVAVVEADAEL